MISIHNTSESKMLQRVLESSQKLSSQATKRIATGYKINDASDNPSGYSIATGLTKQLRGIETANQNAVMGQSIVELASSGVSSMTDYAGEIKDLALKAIYATDSEKADLEVQAKGIMEQMKNVKNGTQYGTTNVFREEGFTFQVGYTGDSSSTLSVDTSLEPENLDGFDIDNYEIDFTSEDADIEALIEDFDNLTSSLSGINVGLGVASNSLEDIISTQESTYEDITDARGNIIDADLAEEISNLSQGEIMSEVSVALMQQASQFNASLVLSLISGFA